MQHRHRAASLAGLTFLLLSCASAPPPRVRPAPAPRPIVLAEARPMKPDPAKLKALGLTPNDVQAPVAITRPQPAYPESARQARVQGSVEMECVITDTGSVSQCRVLKGVNPACDAEAIRSVSEWRYTPTLLKGKPVPAYVTITVQYKLVE